MCYLVGEPAGEDRQEIAQLGRLFNQRRQRGGYLRELGFLRSYIELTDIPFGKLITQDLHHAGVDVDELAGRLDLRLHRAQLNRRDHYVGGQRGVGRDHLKTHLLLLRLQGLHGPAVQAEDIGHVRDADLRGEQIV